jgi:hypothetical protein
VQMIHIYIFGFKVKLRVWSTLRPSTICDDNKIFYLFVARNYFLIEFLMNISDAYQTRNECKRIWNYLNQVYPIFYSASFFWIVLLFSSFWIKESNGSEKEENFPNSMFFGTEKKQMT